MNRHVTYDEFRNFPGPILDVRSPVEFNKGHIPGALNFPLFTNEERAKIGTNYKSDGRSSAIQMGFDIVGPKLGDLVRNAFDIAPGKDVRVHCFRGGLRSKSVAWCLQTAGFRVAVLEGGYKSYRRWARGIVGVERNIRILGGLTGTGKTRILKALEELGEQVIDLEGLANHRGSSFGGLGMAPQPTTQHYENLIAERLHTSDPEHPVWIESESGRVGNCWVPEELFEQMKTAPVVEIVRPLEERLDILTEMYGETGTGELIEATRRIEKRLGGERTKAAVELIEQNNLREACRIILDYYDRSYNGHLERRPVEPSRLNVEGLSAREAAELLIKNASALSTRKRPTGIGVSRN